ncbi:MAG: hypothetical protein Q4F29_13080 [Lachnospiraceae bacterium]|nr:hypothetical protein [Lachnospiraceae bacterium]
MNRIHESHSHNGHGRRQAQPPKKRSDWMEVLLFYLLPFVVVNGILLVLVAARPHITIQTSDTRNYKTASVTVTVKSLLPLKTFTSIQEGAPLTLTETKKGTYTAEVTKNGVIEIHAKGINGMTDTKYEHVNILDDVAPTVNEQYSIRENLLSLTLEDSQSGLDSQSVYAVTPSGATLSPISIDKQTGAVSFEMSEDTLIVHAADLVGNVMQATFSTNMQGMTDENPDAEAGTAETAASETGAEKDTTATTEAGTEKSSAPAAETGTEKSSTPAAEAGTEKSTSPASNASDHEITIHINTKTP